MNLAERFSVIGKNTKLARGKDQHIVKLNIIVRGATMAQSIRLCMSSCYPGFKDQAHKMNFYLIK